MKKDLIKHLRCGLFSDRGTDLDAALKYAQMVFKERPSEIHCITALYVVLNTVANILEEEKSCQ